MTRRFLFCYRIREANNFLDFKATRFVRTITLKKYWPDDRPFSKIAKPEHILYAPFAPVVVVTPRYDLRRRRGQHFFPIIRGGEWCNRKTIIILHFVGKPEWPLLFHNERFDRISSFLRRNERERN